MVSELFEPSDLWDRRLSASAQGLLAEFNRAGVLEAADIQVGRRVSELAAGTVAAPGETAPLSDRVQLALALAVRAVRRGSVCVDLAEVREIAPELAWPEPVAWLAEVAASPLITAPTPPMRLEGELLYLDRYWREEGEVCTALIDRGRQQPPEVNAALLDAAALRVFPDGFEQQRAAARAAALRWTTVITGGPGTGKTTAVAGLLAMLVEQGLAGPAGRRPRIALTAPTGKAAARLQEAVADATRRLPAEDRERLGEFQASTLHRLLGSRPDSRTRFRHNRHNRLPHDVVVCDETSMVSLSMMARLMEALRPDARLILVGDADQLASVEAGAVLADLRVGLAAADPGSVCELTTSHRFGPQIQALAEAVRDAREDEVIELLRAGGSDVEFWDGDPADHGSRLQRVCTDAAVSVVRAAEAGDAEQALAAMDQHRLLCAHRSGPYGAGHWNRQIERWLGDELGTPVGPGWGREWYPGRPVMVTANDYGLGLFNGDTGVVVRRSDQLPLETRSDRVRGKGLRVAMAAVDGHREFAPSRLVEVETLHAMTVHKSQGSETRAVTVLLPPEDSRLATRELLYTAITRAQRTVRIVGSEAALRAAVRRRAQRASGLSRRLAAARNDGETTPG